MTDSTRPVITRIGEDGVPIASTFTSPTDNKVRAQCKAPPDTVVPIIFLPGIMGTNLRDKDSKESIWGVNSLVGAFFQWAFRSAKTRQKKLDPDRAEVDPGKSYSGRSATIPSEKIAIQRGLGEVSKTSYAAFLHWLDDKLNLDCSDGDETDTDDASPWKSMEGKDESEGWHAEKPFVAITNDESLHAWENFYCPVHAAGYNWIKSNGDSGKTFVQRVDEIIAHWNDPQNHGGREWHCEQVILVTHSMGGLVARAAIHAAFGDAAEKVLGIVHGVMPATGAPAAYHHVRSGYDFPTGIVLGRNAAQVTAVIANSPGALELMPTHQYSKGWLQARMDVGESLIRLPVADPYDEIYAEKKRWWRLVDPDLIDPAKKYEKKDDDAWDQYEIKTLVAVTKFHEALSQDYHQQTYVHYGADAGKFVAYNTLVWKSHQPVGMASAELLAAEPINGSDPITVRGASGRIVQFEITEPKEGDEAQAGDGTVPAVSGEAPLKQGSVQQSFRLKGFGHQPSYNNNKVQLSVLYCIGKLLQQAKKL